MKPVSLHGRKSQTKGVTEEEEEKKKRNKEEMFKEFPEKIVSHSWGSHRASCVRIYKTATQNNPAQRKGLGQ